MAKNVVGIATINVNNMTFDVFDDRLFFIIIDLNSFCCILFSCLAFYLILFKSPRIIGKYKWYLLNISICSFLYDIYITFIWKPMLFFPSPTMCSTGLFHNFGWIFGGLIGYLLYPILWGISNMSIVWAFVYRWAALAEKLSVMNSWWSFSAMCLIQIFYEFPTTILYLLSALDRSKVLQATINHYPNLAPWVSNNKPCAITSFEASQWTFPFIISMNIQFFAGLPLSLFFLYLAQRQLKAQDKNMSTIVAKMHRDMLKALIMQLIVPFLVMFLPYTLGGILVMGEVNVPILYKMIFFVGSLHSVVNTLMMITFIPSYRRQISKFIEYIIPSNLRTINNRIIFQSATTNANIITRT